MWRRSTAGELGDNGNELPEILGRLACEHADAFHTSSFERGDMGVRVVDRADRTHLLPMLGGHVDERFGPAVGDMSGHLVEERRTVSDGHFCSMRPATVSHKGRYA